MSDCHESYQCTAINLLSARTKFPIQVTVDKREAFCNPKKLVGILQVLRLGRVGFFMRDYIQCKYIDEARTKHNMNMFPSPKKQLVFKDMNTGTYWNMSCHY